MSRRPGVRRPRGSSAGRLTRLCHQLLVRTCTGVVSAAAEDGMEPFPKGLREPNSNAITHCPARASKAGLHLLLTLLAMLMPGHSLRPSLEEATDYQLSSRPLRPRCPQVLGDDQLSSAQTQACRTTSPRDHGGTVGLDTRELR